MSRLDDHSHANHLADQTSRYASRIAGRIHRHIDRAWIPTLPDGWPSGGDSLGIVTSGHGDPTASAAAARQSHRGADPLRSSLGDVWRIWEHTVDQLAKIDRILGTHADPKPPAPDPTTAESYCSQHLKFGTLRRKAPDRGGLCRWCADFRRFWGELPAKAVCEAPDTRLTLNRIAELQPSLRPKFEALQHRHRQGITL